MNIFDYEQAVDYFNPDPPERMDSVFSLPIARRNIHFVGLASIFGWHWIKDIADRIPSQGYVLQPYSSNGWLLLELARRRPDCSFIGLEEDEEQRLWAEAGRDYLVEQGELEFGQVEFRDATWEEFDYSDSGIDLILAPFCFGLTDKIKAPLEKAHRWLAADGALFYYEPMAVSDDFLKWGSKLRILEAKLEGRVLDNWNARRALQRQAEDIYIRRLTPGFKREEGWQEQQAFIQCLSHFDLLEEHSDRTCIDWLIGSKLPVGSPLTPVVATMDRVLGLLPIPKVCRVAWLRPLK